MLKERQNGQNEAFLTKMREISHFLEATTILGMQYDLGDNQLPVMVRRARMRRSSSIAL